jgi:hypothetical protein
MPAHDPLPTHRVGIGSITNPWESRIPGDRRPTVTGFLSLGFKGEQIGSPLRTIPRIGNRNPLKFLARRTG